MQLGGGEVAVAADGDMAEKAVGRTASDRSDAKCIEGDWIQSP
jgi:hypothetical protein